MSSDSGLWDGENILIWHIKLFPFIIFAADNEGTTEAPVQIGTKHRAVHTEQMLSPTAESVCMTAYTRKDYPKYKLLKILTSH